MIKKQLSVFVENRQGRLGKILNVLQENDINIMSMSLADTTEYGLFRLIVDKPELGESKLTENGFSCIVSEVLVINLPHEPGSLQRILQKIADSEIDVEYLYGLDTEEKTASVVVKTSNAKKAAEILSK
ncbi:MAG: amino acid-binding protein [Clostridia bacterium]|nr:amino acid-binding protein [Clostridia bacterium]